MADQGRPQDGLKQSSSEKKTAGARDAKSLKANKNRSLEAPDMPDLSAETAVAEKLSGRGHYKGYDRKMGKIIELSGKGLSFSQISKIPGLPHAKTLKTWQNEDPEFAEAVENAYGAYVDDLAKRTVPYMEQVFSLRGFDDKLLDESEKLPKLKSNWQRDGLNKKLQFQIMHAEKKARAWVSGAGMVINSIAPRRVPGWREDNGGTTDMIVLDVGLGGPIKTQGLPGSPDGQNVQARLAMKREKR